jgi:hypothetical protein
MSSAIDTITGTQIIAIMPPSALMPRNPSPPPHPTPTKQCAANESTPQTCSSHCRRYATQRTLVSNVSLRRYYFIVPVYRDTANKQIALITFQFIMSKVD